MLFQIVVTIFATISLKQAKADGALHARRRRTWLLTLWRMTGTYKPVEAPQFGQAEYVEGRLPSILKLAQSRIRQADRLHEGILSFLRKLQWQSGSLACGKSDRVEKTFLKVRSTQKDILTQVEKSTTA